jgi:hypothetical protein
MGLPVTAGSLCYTGKIRSQSKNTVENVFEFCPILPLREK